MENNICLIYTALQDNKTILASQYKLYLPSEETLRQEIVKEIDEFKGRGE